MANEKMVGDEAIQRELDPHRVEEQRKARQEAESRLSSRRVEVRSDDSDDDVAELLDAIELFEVEVERQGGDLMVNQIGTSQPQDSAFVPPAREAGEPLGRYLARINEKYIRLQERRL